METYEMKMSGVKNKMDSPELKNWIFPEKYFSLGLPDTNIALSNRRFLNIQEGSEGFDWTLFDEHMRIIDGGVDDECESMQELYIILAKEYGFKDALVMHVDDFLEEGENPPIIYWKDAGRWKIWFEVFDKDGGKVGAGVMPTTYAHKSSAERRLKKLPKTSMRNHIVSRTNPFIS